MAYKTLKKTPSLTDRRPQYEELFRDFLRQTASIADQPDKRIKLVSALIKRYCS